MDDQLPEKKKTHSFSRYLLFFMVILILCIVGFLAINDYLYAKDSFDRERYLLQVQTEQNVHEAILFKDTTANLFDAVLNEKMETGLRKIEAEYERAGMNPDRMNLSSVRDGLGQDYDIYLINESGIITHTTYLPELGTDFRTVPYFFDYLSRIRIQDGFFPDRVVRELKGEGKFRKFAYMPTPDHRFILELGLSGQNVAIVTEERDDRGTVGRVAEVNPYIEQVRVFNSMGRRTDNNTLPEEPALTSVKEAIRTRADVEISDPGTSRTIRYIFIDLKQDRYGSDPSRVVEITYSTRSIRDALDRLLLFHLMAAVLAIVLGSLLAVFISRRVTRPIQDIVSDANAIAGGDLDHHIRDTETEEFAVLGTSINTMVDSLQEASKKMRDDAIFQKEMIHRLPVGIFIKEAGTGRYVFWNDACSELFRMPASDVLGKTDKDLFTENLVASITKEDAQLFQSRGEVRTKVVSTRYLGDRIIHLIIVPIFGSGGTPQYILGISRDVSHENINLKMDLLFSLTRQDILDNLSVIMNHLERAQLKHTHNDIQKFFDKTLGSIESIRNQITYMRGLQERGLVSPGWQPVREAFSDALKLLPEHSLDIRADVGSVELFADPLLPRVFFVLLDNSIRNGGSQLTSIRLSARVEGENLKIVYEDNGPGIPVPDKEKIFETGYDEGSHKGFFLAKELLGFTRIRIRETGVPGSGVRFEIDVPPDKFRFTP